MTASNWDVFMAIVTESAEKYDAKNGIFKVFTTDKIERVCNILWDMVESPSDLNGPLVDSVIRRVARS